jgi:hypothetical protein
MVDARIRQCAGQSLQVVSAAKLQSMQKHDRFQRFFDRLLDMKASHGKAYRCGIQ